MSITAAINGVLVEEAGRIGEDIYQRSLHTSPWIDLVDQDEWPEEMGESVSVLVYERTLPNSATPLQWANVGGANTGTFASNSAEDGTPPGNSPDAFGLSNTSVLPPVNPIAFGQTLREYNLQHTALQSPYLNVNDLRVAVKRNEQLGAIRNILEENTTYAWIDRNRGEYTRLCAHQVLASQPTSTGFLDSYYLNNEPDGPTAMPLIPGGTQLSLLTNGILAKIRQQMIRQGAGREPLDRVDGAPIFGLITDSETSDLLKTEVGIREDLRFAGRANELLTPLGVERPYKNFFHIIDDFAPRWNFTAGAWVPVYPYFFVNADLGLKLINNPLYDEAMYMDSIVFHKEVMKTLVPNPTIGTGAGVAFDAVEYRGLWKWLNIPHAVDNPDGTIGFFRGVLSSGSKPIFPEFGYVIRHLRCDVPLNIQTACPNYQTDWVEGS